MGEGFPTDGRRPNTVPPDTLFSLNDEQVRVMNDEELRLFLDQYLGIRVPPNTPRTVLLSKLDSVAVVARDL